VTVHLDHEFTVPVPPAHAWPVLLDVERIGPCLPGATITKVDGRDFEGKVKVKVGPITVTYGGAATFTDIDDDRHRAVLVAKGKEVRGSGTANATITTQLHDQGESTRVTVHTELAITGRPAQFGRGVMADVGAKLLGRFADCLAGQLTAGQAADPEQTEPAPESVEAPPTAAGTPDDQTGSAPATEPAAGAAAPPTQEARAKQVGPKQAGPKQAGPKPTAEQQAYPKEDEAIDLLATAGGPILKRLAPVAAALLLLAMLVAVLRRRGHD
jgi:carbon monoxide dehydrogenase subunit G